MPNLYDRKKDELISLPDLLKNAETIASDIEQALRLVTEEDPNNYVLWDAFYNSLQNFVEARSEAEIVSNSTAALLEIRSSLLEDIEQLLNIHILEEPATSNYLRIQVYTFMVQAYIYADLPERSLEYQNLLSRALPDLEIEKILDRLDLVISDLAKLRCRYGKPRDDISSPAVLTYLRFSNLLKEIGVKLDDLLKADEFSENLSVVHYASESEGRSRSSSLTSADDIIAHDQFAVDKKRRLALAFYKLARCFRKIDYLDDAVKALRNAWRLDNLSNQYVIELAITLQKQATAESLSEAILFLQLQYVAAEGTMSNYEKFQVGYYLTITYCQSAHHNLIAQQMPAAIECMLGAKTAALSAERRLSDLGSDNERSTWRLNLAKAYHNLLAGSLKIALPTCDIQAMSIDWGRLATLETIEVADNSEQRFKSKYRFFMGLNPADLADKVIDFTNKSLAI